MSHFGCPSCSKTVESGWKACPHCGAAIEGAQKTPGRMTGGRLTFLLIVGAALCFLALVMAAIVALVPTGTPGERAAAASAGLPVSAAASIVGVDPDAPELVARAQKLVDAFERKGALKRWTCTGNEAYIQDLMWYALDVDGKRGITGALAILCHAQKSGRRMTMKSQQTGKVLARIRGNDFEVE
jgi:hypothetical protein